MYDFSNQFNFNYSNPGGAPKFRPYTPEEEDEKLNSLLAKSMGLMSWVGQAFDKFGRGVRGTLHGLTDLAQGESPNWGGGVLNFIPGSDTIGLTDPAKGIEGRDLLENWGAPKNIEGFHPIDHPMDALLDVASLGTEIALDPLTYTGIGALTKAGKAEKAAGRMANKIALAPGIKDGHRSLLSFAGYDLLGKDLGAELAAKYVDPAWDKLRYGNRVGLTMGRLFDPEVMQQSTAVGQKLAKETYYPLLEKRLGDALQPIYQQHGELYEKGLISSDKFVKMLRDEVEGLSQVDWRRYSKKSPEYLAGEVGEKIRKSMEGLLKDAQAVGLNVEYLQDAVVTYAARYHHGQDSVVGAVKNLLNAIKPSSLFRNRGRKEFLKDIQGGTNFINDLAAGKVIGPGGEHIWQLDKKEAAEILADYYHPSIGPEEAEARASQLVGWIQSKTAAPYLAGEKKIYNANPLQDQMVYTSKSIKAKTAVDLGMDSMGATAVYAPTPADAPEGYVSVLQTLHDAGTTRVQATRTDEYVLPQGGGIWKRGKGENARFDPNMPYTGAYKTFGEALRKYGKVSEDAVNIASKKAPFVRGSGPAPKYKYSPLTGEEAEAAAKAGLGEVFSREKNRLGPMDRVADTWEGMANYYVPKEVAADYIAATKAWRSPEEVSGIINAYDALLNLWKSSVTQVWPSFHGRNVLGGMYYHWVSGAAKGPAGPVAPFQAAYAALQGRDVDKGILQQLGKGSTQDLLAEARAFGLLKAGTTAAGEKMSPEEVLMSAMQGHIPRGPRTLRQGVREGVGSSFQAGRDEAAERISAIPKDAGRIHKTARTAAIKADETLGALMDIGRKTGNFTEDLLRLGHYTAQRLNGMSPQQAAQSVKKWFFDYAELTPFEKNVMRRVFPFYTWARKNTPLVLQEIVQNPGGKLAQSLRAVNEPREGDTYVPEWVGQGGVAIPTGKPGRYLTGLGLPFESAFNWSIAPTIGKTAQRNIEGTIASMNPVISGLYAVGSGRDPYSGRVIEEMKVPSTGNIMTDALIGMSQDPIMMRTPLSRAITTARRVMDTRKGDFLSAERAAITLADFLTGVKVTDLPGGPEAQKEMEGRKALNQIMRIDPEARRIINSYTRFYADPSVPVSAIPPSVNEYLRLQATLERNARERAKQKRKEKLSQQQELLITPQ